MKAISLWQPWASLIAVGAKTFETRSWNTKYRGPIAIHAAAKSVNSVIKECFPLWQWSYSPDFQAKQRFEQAVNQAFSASRQQLETLPTGVIVATATLVECHKIFDFGGHKPGDSGWIVMNGSEYEPTEQDLAFGNWEVGRYAWRLTNITPLERPIPAKGKQGLWEWDGLADDANQHVEPNTIALACMRESLTQMVDCEMVMIQRQKYGRHPLRMPYCGRCAKRVDDIGQKYCAYCGIRFNGDQRPATYQQLKEIGHNYESAIREVSEANGQQVKSDVEKEREELAGRLAESVVRSAHDTQTGSLSDLNCEFKSKEVTP